MPLASLVGSPLSIRRQSQAEYQAEAQLRLRRRNRPPELARFPGGSVAPEDIALRAACEWDLGLFGQTFFPHIFPLPYNTLHTDYYAVYRIRHGSRGHRDVTAAPRGASKTTGCKLLAMMHACVYRTERFILYITNQAENAEQKVKQVRDELSDNAELTRVYGSQQGSVWNQGHFRTSRTHEHPGVTAMAGGRLTQLRGATQRFARPTLILVDDVEHPEQVLSESQRFRTRNWLYNDILKLGTPRTNVEVSGTILHPQSLLQELLDSPGWTPHFYQAVTAFASADSLPLWQQWRTLFLDRANPQHQEQAHEFFQAHQAAMAAGAAVLWPAYKDYYALMVERLVEGETAFWQEMQNAPMADQRYVFDMDRAAYCTLTPAGIRCADRVVPWMDVTDLVAFFDPALGRGKDCACLVIVARDTAGYEYVLDAYCDNLMRPDAQDQALVDMLWLWQCSVLGIEVNGYQSLLPKNIRETVRRKAEAEGARWEVQLLPVTHITNKMLRIKSLESLVTNGWLVFSDRLPSEYLRQFAQFIPVNGAGRDDGPDATEAAIALVRGKARRKDAA